ncbi:3087_t:CDS:1 [Acaulospora morrowiae]|uniref:3087_t:CDS:1 n=1 Tax=Acaulospora morrowiae TaxID=94023 RepID=A0A9N9NN59_9GLOM|nr:3087_t:CDS:1 [Acaulospora morrowiae]
MDEPDKLVSELIQSSVHLKIACISLRACYEVDEDVPPELLTLRNEATINAKVYYEKIMPFANLVVTMIQNVAFDFKALHLDEIKKDIEYHRKKARKNSCLANYTKELHMGISQCFKQQEDHAKKILEKYRLDLEEYEEHAKILERKADHRYIWAIALAFFPGLNLIVSPMLKIHADADKAKSLRLVATALAFRDTLPKSLDNFASSLDNISGFFNNLENDLISLIDDDDDGIEHQYNAFRLKVDDIIESCKQYKSSIPGCITDLRAIPIHIDEIDVKEWFCNNLHEKEDGKMVSYLDWGEEVLYENNPALQLLRK